MLVSFSISLSKAKFDLFVLSRLSPLMSDIFLFSLIFALSIPDNSLLFCILQCCLIDVLLFNFLLNFCFCLLQCCSVDNNVRFIHKLSMTVKTICSCALIFPISIEIVMLVFFTPSDTFYCSFVNVSDIISAVYLTKTIDNYLEVLLT